MNSKFYFTSNNEDHRLTITQKNTRFDTRETRAAFCTSPIHRANQKQNQEERFWYHSWKEVLHGFYAELAEKNTLINTSIETSTAGQNKIKLHGAARKSKLKIPDTIITNQEESIHSFFKKNKSTVIKTLHQISLEKNNESAMILVQEVTISDFSQFSHKNECPVFLQEYIEKQYDIRLVVIGKEIIGCKIDASKSKKGKTDWRAYDLPNTPHTLIEIGSHLKSRFLNLMRIYRLDYACIDFCVDRSGEYWLLDVNPFGKYLWIEYATGAPITEKMSEYLIKKHQSQRHNQ